ncbi:ATP-binding protein [Ruminococcus sp.]|uniref:ATP-binding protein n=1 Tax=Ruminococcus sp. TaxID=41978 RepID=UPI0038636B10
MKELTVDAVVENIETVTAFVNAELETFGCSMKIQIQIDVAIDELFGNIAHYAYGHDRGTATVQIAFDEDSHTVTLTFIDSGTPFDPLKREDPDTTLSLKQRSIGGLGIFLVKKTMDHMEYRYEDGHNILSIMKKLR